MTILDRYTCEQVFRRLDDYLDRELTPEEQRLVERHLEACAQCAAEYRFEASVLVQVREKVRRLEAPAGLMGRISRLLATAEAPPAPAAGEE